MTILRIVDDLEKEIVSEQSWQDSNRNNKNLSDRFFNKKVNETNGKIAVRAKLLGDYNRNCKGNFAGTTLRSICTSRQPRMGKYLYESDLCTRHRKAK